MLSLDFTDNVKSLGAFHSKYTKEILKNTKVGWIPEVLTLVLTPILTYIYMSNARYVIYQKYVRQYGCQKKC